MNAKTLRCLAAGGVTLAIAAGGLLAAPASTASAALPTPAEVYQDYNNAVLVRNSQGTFYSDKVHGTSAENWWKSATEISAAEDAYQLTHSPADQKTVTDLLTTFLKRFGTTWTSWITWNDDIGWMANALLRGYQSTGNPTWLNTTKTQWDNAYNRGWSTNGGGGIWESQAKHEKCLLSNAPFVFTGVPLFRATGDRSYLTKAEAIYAWERKTLYIQSTGEVKHCIEFPDGINGGTTIQGGNKAYDYGIFIEGAGALYRATGDKQYYDDGVKALDYIVKKTPIMQTSQYWFFRGLGEFGTDTGTLPRYADFINANAVAAAAARDSNGLVGVDWNEKSAPLTDPFGGIGIVGLYQILPPTTASVAAASGTASAGTSLAGTYTITNANSKLAIGAQNGATTSLAAIVQGATGQAASWTLVPHSGGYYEIHNTQTGLLMNVAGNAGFVGGKVIQYPNQGISQGNDQWLPIKNADGTYSFYNRNSQLALDVPGASTTVGTALQQGAQDNTAAQKFILTKQ